MRQVVPNFWFDGEAEPAAKFYETVFDNVKIYGTSFYTDEGKEVHGHNAGDVLTVEFEIEGQHFTALNGGPQFKVNPSISFFVNCTSVDEVNKLWEKLATDGSEVRMQIDEYPFSKRYGWVEDKFGVNWQLHFVEGEVGQKIVPSLMFTGDNAGKAEEALNFYASVFPNSAVGMLSHYPENGPSPDKPGSINYGELTIDGYKLTAMDSALDHDFFFNEGVSLSVECQDQQEIDDLWSKLSAVPEAEACGWLKDKYGVSWQIVPSILAKMMTEGTPEQQQRVMAAFMPMKKFDIATLEAAFKQV
jgi:predicted 3-demethylubiquinone-9 3-methyltransferase (glyoxalase superfamily)